jgi:hypothetical protein
VSGLAATGHSLPLTVILRLLAMPCLRLDLC